MNKSMKRSTITNNNWYKSILAGNDPTGDYELIASSFPTGSSVSFTGLDTYSSTYKHLQIRAVTRQTGSSGIVSALLRINGVSTSTYSWHRLWGQGSGVSAAGTGSDSSMSVVAMTATNQAADTFAASVIDIIDAYSTTKNKTVRSLFGATSTDRSIDLRSGVFRSNASVTSLDISTFNNFASGTRISLYGIKG
jgi:hypothetical protein